METIRREVLNLHRESNASMVLPPRAKSLQNLLYIKFNFQSLVPTILLEIFKRQLTAE